MFLFRCIWFRLAFDEHIGQFVLAVVIHKCFHADLSNEVLGELTAKDRPDDSVTDRAREPWHKWAS